MASWLKDSWEDAWGSVSDFFESSTNGIGDFFSSTAEKAKQLAVKTGQTITDVTSTAYNQVKTLVGSGYESASGALGTVGEWIGEKASDVGSVAKTGIVTAYDWLKNGGFLGDIFGGFGNIALYLVVVLVLALFILYYYKK